MWRGLEYWLLQYGWEMCAEWIKRGYADTLQRWFDKQQGLHVPFGFGFTLDSKPDMPWLTPSFCLSHRSNLIRKLPSHYGPMWPKHDYQTRLTDAEIAAQIESTLRKFFSARVMPR